MDAAAHRRDLLADRVGFDQLLREQPVDGEPQRHPGAGNGRGAGAAVGLDDVAIERDLPLAERFEVDDGAQAMRPISRWISWVRPDCLPPAASRRPRVWVARGSMPYSAVTQPRPLPRSQAGRLVSTEAVHSTRVSPKLDQAAALGVAGEAGLHGDGAHLVWRAA